MSIDRTIASIPSMTPEERRKMRANAEKALATGKDGAKADARRLLEALDAQKKNETEALASRARKLPRTQLVLEAFAADEMTETDRKIVQVLLDNPGLSSSALSEKLGWGGMAWHMHFGEMCKKRISRLWPAPHAEKRDADFYCGILADLSQTHLWTMKPEAAVAFASLGLRPNRNGRS
jgi:hypothetical protein